MAAAHLFEVIKFMAVIKGFSEKRGGTILVLLYIDILVVELPPVVWVRPAIWLHSCPHLPGATAADEAWYWLKCVLRSGRLCFFSQGDVVR